MLMYFDRTISLVGAVPLTPGSSVQQGGGWLTPLCSTSTLTHPGAVFILVLLPRSPSVTSLPSLVSSEGLSNDSTVRTASFCAKIELQYWAEFLCSFLETMSLYFCWCGSLLSVHDTIPFQCPERRRGAVIDPGVRWLSAGACRCVSAI